MTSSAAAAAVALPPPYKTGDKNTFGHQAARERWPVILTGVADDLHRAIAEINPGNTDKINQGKQIINQVLALKYQIEHSKLVQPLDEIEGSDNDDIKEYNAMLKQLGDLNWLEKAPWLYAECYLYRYLQLEVSKCEQWRDYDIFGAKKVEAFEASKVGVHELCTRYRVLSGTLGSGVAPEVLQVLFAEFVDISLWGNATDLSLLVTVSLDDIKGLQGAEARQKSKKNILVDDTDTAYAAFTEHQAKRVDLVLDNAGFELFTDLIFALFLLDSGLARQVCLHPKNMPWFVSDVIPLDFDILVSLLRESPAFRKECSSETLANLDFVASKLQSYRDSDQITIHTSPFWTTAYSFWEINENGKGGGRLVWETLKESSLVIFKGDLNYRKLVGDLAWPKTTPFRTALGALASAGVRVLALRTCKADVVAGLQPGVEDAVRQQWLSQGNTAPEAWAYSGKWALIQFNE